MLSLNLRLGVAVCWSGALIALACSKESPSSPIPNVAVGGTANGTGGTSSPVATGGSGTAATQGGATSGGYTTSSAQGGANIGGTSTITPQGGAATGGNPTSTAQGGTTTGGNTTSTARGGGSSGIGGATAAGGSSAGSGGTTTPTSGGTNTGGQSTVSTGGTVVIRQPDPRPAGNPADCGSWALTEGVCCAQNCSNDPKSESCAGCGGPGSAQCQVVNAKACESGQWPEVHSVTDSEPWHYSRSTHFGLTAAGACAFGLYGLCTTAFKFSAGFAEQCDAFCKAYPDLCKDPADITLHGNFSAPQGNYYTQFWSSLPGNYDNYLSCGECFEIMRTKKDGTEYQPGEAGYTPPIVTQVVDSCPCAPNSKWCCGSGRDHCGEISDFTYGCQLPPSPPPPVNHDPVANESIHFDLSDIAMARLQSGSPTGAMVDGVIPTKYKRIPCPVVGNMYFWLQLNGNEYYFALTVVNMKGLGAAAKVEARLPDGTWVALVRNTNYTMSRPQERYGTWVLPQNSGKFALPVSIRVTDGSGRAVVAEGAIKAWAPADPAMANSYYIDSGVQF